MTRILYRGGFVVENPIEIQKNQDCRVYTWANGTSHTNYCNL
jgi:hypothetical protein